MPLKVIHSDISHAMWTENSMTRTLCVYCIAYGARCMHSLDPGKTEWEENTWPYLLRTEGDALMCEAVG